MDMDAHELVTYFNTPVFFAGAIQLKFFPGVAGYLTLLDLFASCCFSTQMSNVEDPRWIPIIHGTKESQGIPVLKTVVHCRSPSKVQEVYTKCIPSVYHDSMTQLVLATPHVCISTYRG